MEKKLFAGLATGLFLLGTTGLASATTIGMFTDGSTGQAVPNMNALVTANTGYTWSGISDTAFAGMTTATLLADYDILVMPWYVNSSNDMSWNTVINPYLQGGGTVLWEDPNNTDDLAGSGITFGGTGHYTSTDITLVSPFDNDGAQGYYHVHYGIDAADSNWDVWSTDANGDIHGIYGEFGSNGGRMVLGISDNLYHPEMWLDRDADHLALLQNELNWLSTGSVTGEVPEPTTMLLFGTGLAGLIATRLRKKK